MIPGTTLLARSLTALVNSDRTDALFLREHKAGKMPAIFLDNHHCDVSAEKNASKHTHCSDNVDMDTLLVANAFLLGSASIRARASFLGWRFFSGFGCSFLFCLCHKIIPLIIFMLIIARWLSVVKCDIISRWIQMRLEKNS